MSNEEIKVLALGRRDTSLERLSVHAINSAMAKTPTKAIHDGGGLFLRPFKSGSWFWYLRATSHVTGKRVWVTIRPGIPYPQTSLAYARKEARTMREQLSKGIDATQARKQKIADQRTEFAAQKEAERRAVALKTVFDQWQATDLQPRIRADGKRTGRKDGGAYVQAQFERHVFPSLAGVPMESVRKADVLAILDELKSSGRLRTANMILADMKQLFRFALKREIIAANPMEVLDKKDAGGADTSRARALSPGEVRALPAMIEQAGLASRTAAGIWILLATGARIGELMGACSAHHVTAEKTLVRIADAAGVKYGRVDLESRTWYLPTTKNQRDHTIHLSEFAVERFAVLFNLREHPDWLFPDRDGKQPVCVKSFGKQIADRQRNGTKPMKNRSSNVAALGFPAGKWTPHDLRRTAATLMAMMGESSDAINECLIHVTKGVEAGDDKITRVYVRSRREALQITAFDRLGETLRELVIGTADPNLTHITPPRPRRPALVLGNFAKAA